MSKEIQPPNIARPDLTDPFSWAVIPRVHTEWIRQVGPQLGIDVEKYVLGGVLADIIGDDANCFTWTSGGNFFDSKSAVEAKRNLLERMDWEVATPETPLTIKKRLESTLQLVSSLNWSDREEFEEARTEWYKFKGWVEHQIKRHPTLKEAEKYRLTMGDRLSEYWRKFLFG